jgi:hypothetical protein
VNPQVFRPWFAFDSVTGITGNLVWPSPMTFTFAIPIADRGADRRRSCIAGI